MELMKCQDWEPAAAAAAVSLHRVCCVTAATWSSGAQPPGAGVCILSTVWIFYSVKCSTVEKINKRRAGKVSCNKW